MKSVNELKGLCDVSTAISSHRRSASRHKGTPYLEILSLGMEKLRLEAELAQLTKRRHRTENRLGQIRSTIAERLSTVQEEAAPVPDAPVVDANKKQTPKSRPSGSRSWSTMTLEY